MILPFHELETWQEKNEDGSLMLTHNSLKCFAGFNTKIRLFSLVELEPHNEVPYHTHTGENETYFFLSGTGLYSDNGTEKPVTAGVTTFCPDGEGHGVKNTGTDTLRFICMVVVN